ncbi:MAG: hypothetical protein M1818_003536 [Claussenomyces sp. TS43310]|nr:MAG: hypothetical protein M1818_003536 [Claussenomyces sp. TS43310]
MYIPFLVFLFAAWVQCRTVPQSHAVHEKRDAVATQWIKRHRIESRALLPMRVGLSQRHLENGHDYLMDVAQPESPNYAKYWTSEEVVKAFAPTPETVATVRTWLVSSGIADERITHSDNQGWLAFDATAEEAENLLHAEYHEYHVPKAIQEHIDYITPGIKLISPMKKRSVPRPRSIHQPGGGPQSKADPYPLGPADLRNLSTCDRVITPICIAALYEIPKGTKADPSNAMGIFEEDQYLQQSDLNYFFGNFSPQIPQGTYPKLNSIDGGQVLAYRLTYNVGEADLDFQIAYPIVWPQRMVLYQTDDSYYANSGNGENGFLNTFLDAIDGSYCTYSAYGETGNDPTLDPVYPDTQPGGYKGKLQCGVYKPTNVISISYGEQESDLPAYYQQRQCNEYMKLGLQGVSIILASGDDGPAAPISNVSGCIGPNNSVFSPGFPNTCPYLTNVGATQVLQGSNVFEPESASDAFPSGGGFSNIYPIPSYQASAVATDHDPPFPYYSGNDSLGANDGVYNRSGRGFPDVAANGVGIAAFEGEKFVYDLGTSASAPIFASIVNRINEERIAIGKNPVGFINPVLYAHPEVLNDITNGTNNPCQLGDAQFKDCPGSCRTYGFSAVDGWDPVTGLGTPNYPKMLDLFLGLS